VTTIRVVDVAYHLPDGTLTNAELHRAHPDWNMDRIEQRTGVRSRHIAAPGETALDLALGACLKLFEANPTLRSSVDAVLFCTQSPDYVMPPNSALLHKLLGLPESVFALDFNLACSGYVYGLALALGLAASGIAKNILLVTADTYSRYVHPLDRSARVLFGDAAAATWLMASDQPGLIDVVCGTVGSEGEAFMVPAGGCRVPRSAETAKPTRDLAGNVRTAENIRMDGQAVLEFMKRVIPSHVRGVLGRSGLTIGDVRCVIFHQASALALDWLEQELHLAAGQSFRNLLHVGNTVSASIPIALKDAMTQGVARPGDKILLVSFGVGLSYGSSILQL
jgi:3-oxoacyl-[acyl-carrier-protein] synthase-3